MTMTIPFLSFFKKVKDQALARTERSLAAPKPVAPLEKPSSERFSKTVMPNATRTLPPQDPFEMAARSSATSSPLPTAGATASAPSAQRTIAFGANAPAAGRQRDLPPAVALALEPRVERVISLDLGDIAAQIPADYIKPIESIDGTRRILLKASEVERGMATGKPAVSLATIYQQVPEIFLRSIASAGVRRTSCSASAATGWSIRSAVSASISPSIGIRGQCTSARSVINAACTQSIPSSSSSRTTSGGTG